MKEINFEQKIEDAKKILEQLMDPEITLSQSVTYYKEGVLKLKEATDLLERAKLEIETYNKENKESS